MSTNTVISYPIPPFQNLPIEPQFYQPNVFVITNVSLGKTTTLTLQNGYNNYAPNYIVGQLVRLLFPSKYGCQQLNEKTGYVISLPSASQVEVNIDSTNCDPFIPLPIFLPYQSKTPPQIVAVGDISSGAINNFNDNITSINVPGSFENIS